MNLNNNLKRRNNNRNNNDILKKKEKLYFKKLYNAKLNLYAVKIIVNLFFLLVY